MLRNDIIRTSGLRQFAAVCAVALAASGCMMQDQSAPDLAGPSGFAYTLTMLPTPQALPRDGRSQSSITLNARDEIANKPVAGQRFRIVAVPSTATLSASEVTTAADGRATFTVVAPPSNATDDAISVVASPIDGIADRVGTAVLSIALIGVAGGDPAPRFTVSPAQPLVDDETTFDASASTAATGSVIVLYSWTFGDGTEESSTTPVIEKTYDEARTFAVTLTVTDNLGRTSTTARTVTVVP